MKILFLCASPPQPHGSGPSVVAYNRIRMLAERGHTIGLAAFMPSRREPIAQDLESVVFEMQILPAPKRADRILHRLEGLVCPSRSAEFGRMYALDMRKLVGRLVAHSRYDVVIAESSPMGQYLYRNPHLPAVRRVISSHGMLTSLHGRTAEISGWTLRHFHEWWRFRRIDRYERSMYRFADLVLTLTFGARLELLRREPDLNIAVAPFGVDLAHTPRFDTALSEERVLLAVGTERIDRDAAMWFARRVWPALAESRPGLRLCIAGLNLPRDVRAMQRRFPRIDLADGTDDLESALSRARVFVSAARVLAGFHASVLRAMSTGVPVVSTSSGADCIPAETGTNLILADTPRTMSAAVGVLLDDAELRRRIGARARHSVEQRFSSKQSIDSLEEVLSRLLA